MMLFFFFFFFFKFALGLACPFGISFLLFFTRLVRLRVYFLFFSLSRSLVYFSPCLVSLSPVLVVFCFTSSIFGFLFVSADPRTDTGRVDPLVTHPLFSPSSFSPQVSSVSSFLSCLPPRSSVCPFLLSIPLPPFSFLSHASSLLYHPFLSLHYPLPPPSSSPFLLLLPFFLLRSLPILLPHVSLSLLLLPIFLFPLPSSTSLASHSPFLLLSRLPFSPLSYRPTCQTPSIHPFTPFLSLASPSALPLPFTRPSTHEATVCRTRDEEARQSRTQQDQLMGFLHGGGCNATCLLELR